MCTTKALLNGAGFEVLTATTLEMAKTLGRCISFRAAVVCRHSFSDAEREHLSAELQGFHPDLQIVLACPGCTGCVEREGRIGTLEDISHIQIITSSLNRQS
jgi:hypothetical protein